MFRSDIRVSQVIATGIVIGYMIWGAGFIYRTSIPLDDGSLTFCLFDDAMISMRYAENLANGHGLVWNIGERVEGYTNPLMVLIMAVFSAFFQSPLRF
jgi:arabinofuranosyltransferase